MKKFITSVIITAILLILNIVASAEILPIKDAWIWSSDEIIILRENGDLLFTDSIDSQNYVIIAQDVEDYCSSTILYKNGDVASLHYYAENKEVDEIDFKIEVVGKNAKALYALGDRAWINNKNQLKLFVSNPIEIYGVSIDNIRKVCDSYSHFGKMTAISTDDILYKIDAASSDEIIKQEIMTNVKDAKSANGDLLVLRNNGDLYFIRGEETPNRIGTNIEDLNDVVFYDTWTTYGIEFVNRNGEYFAGNDKDLNFKKYMDNVKDIYRYGDDMYALTNENNLYSFYSGRIDVGKANIKAIKDVQKMFGDDENAYFILNSKNNLYTTDELYVLGNVKDVIIYDGGTKYDNDRYLFIKNDGSLWGAYGKYYREPKPPFLTAFCQKPTKVFINKKEIELTAKIQEVNDRTMYPFRECLENMGANVLWDSANQVAIGEYNGITIEFPIGKSEYWINGIKHEMDVPSYVDESIGRTYIPIRFAAEGLGFTVDWTAGKNENTISIYE